MNSSDDARSSPHEKTTFGFSQALLIAISLAALVATFFLANSALDYDSKLKSFAAILISYLIVFFAVYFWGSSREGRKDQAASDNESLIENRLFALEEANEFFGTSLKPSDLFRLVSSRVSELTPFKASALYLINDMRTRFRVAQADGANFLLLQNSETSINAGLAGKALGNRRIEVDRELRLERAVHSAETMDGFKSAIAVPLFYKNEVFGVLQLYSDARDAFNMKSISILEAVSERIAPMFLSSMAFEKSLSNALTDVVTGLPNERAFYLVLETQLAESQRNRDDRPLSVLAVDIRSFGKLNKRYGHAAGDRILAFVAELTSSQLRRMNFFSRAMNDEFLIVLPTATGKIAKTVATRIARSFESTPFQIAPDEKIHLALNFGWATFWQDGETSQQLLQMAIVRKNQNKSDDPGKVISFPSQTES